LNVQRATVTPATLVTSLILTGIALAVACLAVRTLILFAVNADLLDLAAAIEKGAQPDAVYLARFVAGAAHDGASIGCSDPVTRASLTVNLAGLEAATNALDTTLIDSAERNARRAAERRLICNPLDGNAWLRYAIVLTRANGPVASALGALRVSYWAAPSESWVIEPRLAFATNLHLAGVESVSSEYLNDLRRYVALEPIGRVAAFYVAAPGKLRAALRPLIDAQIEARRRAVIAEIDRLSVDDGRQPQ
jgi:hypothetical protein